LPSASPVAERRTSPVRLVIRSLRLHQWLKNLLVLAPLLLSHRVLEAAPLVRSLEAFLSFSFFASGLYLMNDLFDAAADRLHPRKRFRPVASGQLAPRTALCISGVCLALGVIAGSRLGLLFEAILALYAVASLAYSARLKTVVLLDVVLLSLFYILRLFAGGVAAGIVISPWTLSFSMFAFFSLAVAKRVSELRLLKASGATGKLVTARGYSDGDLEQLSRMGSAAGLISVLVIALYIESPDVRLLYRHPQVMWLLCPVFLYWIGRVWLLANRGRLDEDVVLFAARDLPSYAVAALSLAILGFAL
jgi:4-hydroxybenzoate polyprenyltransferase